MQAIVGVRCDDLAHNGLPDDGLDGVVDFGNRCVGHQVRAVGLPATQVLIEATELLRCQVLEVLEVGSLVLEQVQSRHETQARGVLHDAVVCSALKELEERHRLIVNVNFLGVHLPELNLSRDAVQVFDNLLLGGVVRGHAIGNH